jgi:hypothetical protein
MPQNFQEKCQETGANNGEPERFDEIYFHILARNPNATAKSAVVMIGTPGTK